MLRKSLSVRHLLAFIFFILGTSAHGQLNSVFELSSADTTMLTQQQLTKYRKVSNNQTYVNPILIEVQDLISSQDSGRIKIHLLDFICDDLPFLAKRVKYTDSDNYYWYGEIVTEGDEVCDEGTLTLMALNGEKFGYLTIDSLTYEFHELGDGIQVLAMLNDRLESTCAVSSEGGLSETIEGLSTQIDCGNACEISVFVYYTQGAFNAEVNINNRIALSIEQTNQAFYNSRVLQKIQIVLSGSALLPNFIEGTNIHADVQAFNARTDAQNTRNSTSSDLMMLLTSGPYANAFGVVSDIGPNFSTSYGLAQTQAATSGRFTFAHELAHLLGCKHDEPRSAGYQYGYRFKTGFLNLGKERWTIMAIFPTNGRIQHYSNPDVKYRNRETGVHDERDNARKIDEEGCVVANFYPNPTAPVTGILSGYDVACGCKGADYWVTPYCGTAPYSYQWEISFDGIVYLPTGGNVDNIRVNLLCRQQIYVLFVRVTITDATGWQVTLSKDVLVIPLWSARTCDQLPGIQSSTSKGHTFGENATNNTAEKKLTVEVFPQPAQNALRVVTQSTSETLATFTIVDLSGRVRKVLRGRPLNKGETVTLAQIADLSSGSYILLITTSDGFTSKKVVVVK